MIGNRNGHSFDFIESKEDKGELKKNIQFSKNSTKEVTSISTSRPIQITGKSNWKICNKEASHTKRALGEEISIP